MATPFSEKQIEKVFELKEKGKKAQEIADHINGMAMFEDDPDMTANSVYGICGRYRPKKKTRKNGKQKMATPCYVRECLISPKNGASTMTLSVPSEDLGRVQRQLGIVND